VFSIAHEDGDDRAGVYYRGQITFGPANNDGNVALIPVDNIPWDWIKSLNQRSMLTRYIKERTESRFGIYVGPAAGGAIKGLEVKAQI
jgi:flavin-dependent trigonelline monooxygenase, reductase component